MFDESLQLGNFKRSAVLHLGNYNIDSTPFTERGLAVQHETLTSAAQLFHLAKAIVLSDKPGKFGEIKKFFDQLIIDATNHGLAVMVFAQNDNDYNVLQHLIPEKYIGSLYLISHIAQVAETIARHSPGPPLEDVKIEPDGVKLDREQEILLKRSFFGCEKIHLEPIGGGKGSLGLFKVHAWMKKSAVGPLPMPFFAKIGLHKKIRKEIDNYWNYTDLYIPFRYRPNCRIERCTQTENYASLVGNFVDNAIPLRKALIEAHSSGIIFSLFEKSLRGFRIQPVVARLEPIDGALKDYIEKTIQIHDLLKRSDVLARAQELGLRDKIQVLYERLLEKCPLKCLVGPYHGDLNARNIMVLGEDAILIDFYSIGSAGPLTADPADIEISLCFDLDEDDFPEFIEWQKLIDDAFAPNTIHKPIALTDVIPNKLTWLRRAIRETRHILAGCHCCNNELTAIIACYLLRIARLAPKEFESNKEKAEFEYRAYALVVAERLIMSL